MNDQAELKIALPKYYDCLQFKIIRLSGETKHRIEICSVLQVSYSYCLNWLNYLNLSEL